MGEDQGVPLHSLVATLPAVAEREVTERELKRIVSSVYHHEDLACKHKDI